MPRAKREKKLITLDTETYNGLVGGLKRIAIYDGVEITYGYTFNDVLGKILEWSADFNVHIYIHNLEFDARKIPEIFNKGNVVWNQTKMINGKYVTIQCKNYCIHDSFRLLPMSLAKLSEDFGLKHGKLDLWEEVQKKYPNQYKDNVDFLDRCDVDNELYVEYLGYDVLSLYELIEKLCVVSGLDFDTMTKCMTTSTISKKILKYGYKGKIFKDENAEMTDYEYLTKNKWWDTHAIIKNNNSLKPITYIEIEEKIRKSFCGGRTEMYKPLLENKNDSIVGYHMDVNSLYPSKMINKNFPIGAPVYYDDPFEIQMQFSIWKKRKNGLGFITAKIFIPKCHIPPLPIKIEKLVFPCGYISGTWTYIELDHAIEKYGVKVIEYKEMIHFTGTFPVFKHLIEVFSEIKIQSKLDGNLALYTFSKLVQNAAFGWTGMRRDDKTELKDISDSERFKERLLYINDDLGYCELQSIVKSDSIQVQIASYVTSYARLELLSAFEKLQEMKADIYYCDTDSIVSNILLPDEMIDSTKLGLWDVEGKILNAIFIQPKVYYENIINDKDKLKENFKFKGVSKGTIKDYDKDFIFEIYEKLKAGKEKTILLERQRIVLRSVNYMQKKKISYKNYEVRDKMLNLKNKQKRIIDYKNNTSEPYYFSTLEEFENFNFKFDFSEYRDKNGNVFNPIM